MKILRSRFPSGIITASVTPMDHELNADIGLLVDHCKSLLEKGSNGIVLLGTTGEANSFSVNERKAILESALDGGIAPEFLMVGTGCCAMTDTIDLTTHALDHGVTNVLVLPPFYYKPVSDEALFNYYSRVIETPGDQRLQMYLYHFPKNTGIDLSLNLISELLDRYSDTVVGIKDSGGDWHHMQMVMREFPSFRLFSGSEEYLSDTLKAGGAGCISATANVTLAVAAEIVRMRDQGANADDKQKLLTSLRRAFDGHAFVGAIKGFLAMETGIQTWKNVRPPNEIINEEMMASIWNKYHEILRIYPSIVSEALIDNTSVLK